MKLANLTKSIVLPFKHEEVITNLSTYQLANKESDLRKYGLNCSLQPLNISKTDVLVTFGNSNKFLCS